MLKWRLLVEEGRKVNHTFSQPDPIIAATALHHGLTIVSRDIAVCARAGAPMFNPNAPDGPELRSRPSLRLPVIQRQSLEAALGVLMPAADDAAQQHVGFDVGVHAFGNFLLGDA
jgi:hypothetical protein